MENRGSYRLSSIYLMLTVLLDSHLMLAIKGIDPPFTVPQDTMETTKPTYTNTTTPGIHTFPLHVYGTIPNTECWTSVGECFIPTNISEFDEANVNISIDQESDIVEDSFDDDLLLQDFKNAKWFIWELVNYTTAGINVTFSHCDSDTLIGTCSWKFSFKTTAVSGPPKFSKPEAKTTLFQNLTKIPQSPSSQTPRPTTTTTRPKTPVNKTIRTPIAPTMACMCPCVCNTKPISQDRMETLMKEIKEDMVINVTSQEKRRLVSASDKRLISHGIGYIGILVMAIVFGVILIGDAKLLIHDTKAALRNFRNKLI